MEISEQIEKFQEFFENYKDQLQEIARLGLGSIQIDFSELAKSDLELSELLLLNPDDLIKAAEMSLTNFDIPAENIRIRFFNLPKSQRLMIRDIRSIHLGKFISLEGIVRQTSDVRPQVTSAKFECPSCGNTITILQIESKFKEPSRCSCGRHGRFRLIAKELVDAQRIVLEEAPEALEGGEQPKRLAIFLKEDLVEPKMEKRTTPGSKICVTGIVKEISIPLRTGGQSTRFDLVMDANSIKSVQEDFAEIKINKKDLEEIRKLAKDPKIYEKLIATVAPSIYGHEDVKGALVLQLMGGVKKIRKDGTKTRGDMHILLVGDPGSGKSQLLQFISKAAPKARYISGKGASAAGLTATVVKDEFLRGWALEAGALVLANFGVACLDEMDKISVEDTSALHEGMEQQTITISKANIQACYSKDTEVLTEKGWKRYDEVKDLKIAQYNHLDKIIRFLPHKGLYVYDYRGKMYHFKNKRIDMLVTPNHTMLLKREKSNQFEKINAEDIKSYRFKVLNSGNFNSKGKKFFILPAIKHKQNRKHQKYVHQHKDKKIPMGLWLEFLGYFITEGGFEHIPTVGFVQKKGEDANKIKKCLKELTKILGCSLTEIDCGKYIRWKITQTQLYSYLKKLGHKCYDKELLLNFSEFSKKQLEILYKAMMLGDGSSIEKDFGSTSEKLLDEFQAIACLIGKSACKSIQYQGGKRGNRKTMYRVSLCDRTESLFKRKLIKKIDYNGKIFCFSTDTGFFITRRNGKIAIQGNTLRTETTVLAAANPKLGRFDPYSPIASQIDMPPTLINRFDLIFPIRDMPNPKMDERIAKHVLKTQQKPEELETEIPLPLFRKYIAYVKQSVFPQLTEAAMTEIKNFYVDLRNRPTIGEESAVKPIPISARQLEALVRLAEGSARVRLSKKITKQDAERAIKILKHCLMQVGFDYETGQIDIDRISTGLTASERGKIISVRGIINDLEKRLGAKMIPIEDVVMESKDKGINEDKVNEAIEKLKRSGDLFEPRRGFIQRL